ncbi:MAG: cell division protein ZipA C-terminal FtsZ-binding domain-containing protein [Steroidobacteraceae bacterium]
MNDLQWALAILGVLFLAGLGFREWRRARGSEQKVAPAAPPEPPAFTDPPRLSEISGSRREPHIAEFDAEADPPVLPLHEAMPLQEAARWDLADDDGVPDAGELPEVPPPAAPTLRVGIAAEQAVDIPGATTVVADDPKPIRWPPEQLPERVLGLRVIASGGVFGGKPARQALLAAGLRHGPQQIFHKTDRDGNVLASVANLVRPGSLIPDQMDGQEFRGLSLFAVLPGPQPAARMLDGLVQLARQLASRLGGVVQDEHGRELDAERLAQLRQAVAAIENGDGADA